MLFTAVNLVGIQLSLGAVRIELGSTYRHQPLCLSRQSHLMLINNVAWCQIKVHRRLAKRIWRWFVCCFFRTLCPVGHLGMPSASRACCYCLLPYPTHVFCKPCRCLPLTLQHSLLQHPVKQLLPLPVEAAQNQQAAAPADVLLNNLQQQQLLLLPLLWLLPLLSLLPAATFVTPPHAQLLTKRPLRQQAAGCPCGKLLS